MTYPINRDRLDMLKQYMIDSTVNIHALLRCPFLEYYRVRLFDRGEMNRTPVSGIWFILMVHL